MRGLDRLVRALEAEHCGPGTDVASCDICFAYEKGLYLWAAFILIGATECPRTESAYLAIEKRVGPDRLAAMVESERKALLAYPHKRCPKCNAITWGDSDDEIESCGACGHDLRKEMISCGS